MNIKVASFNDDTNCVEVCFNDFATVNLYTPDIEDNLHTTMYTRSQLELLVENNPIEYAEMVLNGTIQNYLDLLADENKDTSNTIRNQLKERYPDMSDTQIDNLVREFSMYNS